MARILVRESPAFEHFRRLGLAVSARLASLTRGTSYTHDLDVLGPIAAEVPDAFVDAFCIAATPQTLGDRLAILQRHGFTHILVNPIPAHADEVEPVLEAVGAWRTLSASPAR